MSRLCPAAGILRGGLGEGRCVTNLILDSIAFGIMGVLAVIVYVDVRRGP